MVPARETWFVHRSDSPVLTFWKLEVSLIWHGVVPTGLRQPNVGLIPIRAGGPSRLLQLRQIKMPHGHTNRSRSKLTAVPYLLCCPHNSCQFGLSTAQGQDLHSLGPRFHELATPHRNTSHCGLSRGVASSKVCITNNLNIVVQFGSMGICRVIRGCLTVYRATLFRAVRSCVRGDVVKPFLALTFSVSTRGLACPKQRN